MLKVFAPDNFRFEKAYIIEVYLSDFLGLDYDLEFYAGDTYKIVISDFCIEFEDAFWADIPTTETYLQANLVPQAVARAKFDGLTSESDLPVLYGSTEIQFSRNSVLCGVDILAGGFLLLTRWEEAVCTQKDVHGRFPDSLNVLVRFGLHHRPVVNEYVEFLWNLLVRGGCKQNRKFRKFTVKQTHDIDLFAAYPNPKRFFKRLAGSLLKRQDFHEFIDAISDYFNILMGCKSDPYDTFDLLMDKAEQNNSKAVFNFIPGNIGEADADYNIDNPRVVAMIKHILARGHRVGIHASYDSFDNSTVFKRDLDRLRALHPGVCEGRQHYLRFSLPKTWRLWADNNLLTDSSLGFSTELGFRCGTCFAFPVFDIENRVILPLIEESLIFMDTVLHNRSAGREEYNAEYEKLKFVTQKYNGNFVVLVHNNSVHNYI